jgi:hypothetical protein
MDMNAITTYATRVTGKGLRMQMVEQDHSEIRQPWQFSTKLEVNAKGFVQPSVHVYSDKADCHEMAVILLERTVKQLRLSGFKVATDMGEPAVING